MRILFASLATHGHTYPLIPLALAARDAGHDVVYATGERMTRDLRAVGLTTETTIDVDLRKEFGRILAEEGITADRAQEVPPEVHVRMITEVFGRVYPRALIADLAPIIERHRPDLVVQESGNPGAGLAAKLAGVPNVIHPFGRGGPTSADDPFSAQLLGLAAEVGVDLSADKPQLGLGDGYLDIFPPSLQDKDYVAEVPDRTLLRPVPFGLPGELPASVTDRGDRKLVYLTLGTGFAAPDVLRAAITGLSSLDATVLVATGPAVNVADFGPLPENVETHVWVPQAQLLPHADLIVHHGGSGSTLGALASGVPQLFVPQGADHFVNASVITEAGMGRTIAPPALSAESVAVEAKHLLADDAYRHASATQAAEIAAMPSPAEVAARLPEFAN